MELWACWLIDGSYLIAARIIHEPLEHLQLSKLFLYQFCFPNFHNALAADQMVLYVRAGDFALFDYSIVNWIPHLLAALGAHSDSSSAKLAEHDLMEFVEILCIFLEAHWKMPKKKSRASKNMINAVKCLPQLESAQRDQLLQTLASANGLVSSDLPNSTCFEALKLYDILRTVRLTVETLAVDPSACTDIGRFHGNMVYRCPRLYCRWFYEGFRTAAKRDEHVTKHERAYYCSYIGCTHATLGCKTESELELHYQTYHKPSLTDDDFPLPPKSPTPTPPPPPPTLSPPPPPRLSAPSPTSNTPNVAATHSPTPSASAANTTTGTNPTSKRPVTTVSDPYQKPPKRVRRIGPFTCDLCNKVFQKIALLNSHQMVHSNDRPHPCIICHKTFARQPDLTRHAKLHSGIRKFTCHGLLRDGRDWGCNKKFARADGLARHWKGTAGMLCMKPLVDEEEQGRQQHTVPIIAANAPTVASVSTLGQAHTMPHNSPNTTMPDWDYLLLPTSTCISDVPAETFGYDSRLPPILYEQHPEVANFNWDTLRPE
jgi:hypothetical protein